MSGIKFYLIKQEYIEEPNLIEFDTLVALIKYAKTNYKVVPKLITPNVYLLNLNEIDKGE